MNLPPISRAPTVAASTGDLRSANPVPNGEPETPRTPAEAARAFEQILLKQFVQVMTDGLFRSETGGGIAAAGADLQREILTDELSRFLAEEGTLGLSEHLLRRMNEASSPASDAESHS